MRDREFPANPRAAALDNDFAAARSLWRSLALQVLGRRPADSLAISVAAIASGAILINALVLQTGPHPAPFFSAPKPVAASRSTGSAVAVPRSRPGEGAARPKPEVVAELQKELARRGFYEGATDGVYGPRTDAAIREFEHVAALKPSAEPNESLLRAMLQSNVRAPAPAPSRPNDPIADLLAPSRQVKALQRALADYGFGQIKPTGVLDPETQSAIRRFERERKLPVTGQISERLTRELTVLSGRPLE